MMSAQQSQREGGVEFDQWAEAMRGEFDDFLRQTWQAMNAARNGRWIADTEEVMRQARDRLGPRAYEKLLQLRVEAGQGAFSPSRAAPGCHGAPQNQPGVGASNPASVDACIPHLAVSEQAASSAFLGSLPRDKSARPAFCRRR